jgi:NAD(P)-dependent dehydrogenase (short-subunit alcohol dehydrogenase family)
MSLVIVAGAGPGLGDELLRRFSDGGYHAVGFATTPTKGGPFEIHQVDLADRQQVKAALAASIKNYGPPKIVIHNPAHLVVAPLMETTLDDFENCWRAMVLSAFNLSQVVMQPMVANGGGAFIVSGATASLRGGARFAAFASAKFALRGLTQSLAREHQPLGVHVAHVVLDGIVDSARSRALHSVDPARMMQPGDIAEAYWQLAHQQRSTWTHEIDLRPQSEGF